MILHKIHWPSLLLFHIVLPVVEPLVLTYLLIYFFPKKEVIQFVKPISSFDSLLIEKIGLLYVVVVFCLIFTLFHQVLIKLCHRNYIINPQKQYYDGPVHLLELAVLLDSARTINARTVPVWQFMFLELHKSQFPCSLINFEIPDTFIADQESHITVNRITGSHPESKRLVIGIADTYGINYNDLPVSLKKNNYIEIISNRSKLGREYNSNLVQKFSEEISKARQNEVQEIIILPNTIPKHIVEIVRESFSDAGRNGAMKIYVNECVKNSSGVFQYTEKAHRVL